jgi:hypothetical protein
MKKLLFVSMLLLAGLKGRGQQLSKLELGYEIGPSITNLIGMPGGTAQQVTYITTGITGLYTINTHFSIKGGLIYDEKGYYTYSSTYIGNEIETSWLTRRHDHPMEYLVAPAMARYSTKGNLKLFAEGGAWAGYLCSATSSNKTYIDGGLLSDIKRNDIGKYKRLDYGLSFGCGFNCLIDNHFILEFSYRYNRGLVNLKPLSREPIQTETNSFLLGMRYRFWD